MFVFVCVCACVLCVCVSQIQLVGRQQLSFAVSGCMYTTHSTYSMCDYCVPSASMRALLRILGSCVKAPALQNSANSNSNNSISNAQVSTACSSPI